MKKLAASCNKLNRYYNEQSLIKGNNELCEATIQSEREERALAFHS